MKGLGRTGIALVLLSLMPLGSFSAQGWSNGGYSADTNNPDYGTHDWIADRALDIQTRNVAFLRTTYHTEFLLGTEAPDNPAYIGDTANHHVYYYSSGSVQDDVCADRASTVYNLALEFLRSGDNHSAAFDIGVLAHYVSDSGVFGHTMGVSTDWGAEVHHSDYETKFESILSSLSPPSGISLGDSDAYNATMDLARRITFGGDLVKANTWMDTNYNWADSTFEASAMASLSASASAVASVINHLIADALKTPAPPPTSTPSIPERPAGLTAVRDHSNVRLSWSPPPSDGGATVIAYQIYRGEGSSVPTFLATVSKDARTWLDQSVESGRTYTYWVAAQNSVGVSPMSLEAAVTIPNHPHSLLLPIVVSAISMAVVSGGGVLLWRRRARGKV